MPVGTRPCRLGRDKTRQRAQAALGGNDEVRMPDAEDGTQNEESILRSKTAKDEPRTRNGLPKCPCCQQPMIRIARIQPGWKSGALWQPVQSRAPPVEMKGAQGA